MTNAARGYYYSGETSSALKAVLTLSGHEFVVADSSGRIVASKAVHETQFTDRVGTVPRRLMFSDGTSFETPDNDCIDGWLASVGRPRSFVFRLERQLRYVLPSVILAAGILWGMVSFGVPAMATYVARVLPADVLESVGESTLAVLDQIILEPTTLAPLRQGELRSLIYERFAATETDGYGVVFRGGGGLGANAVALPDGTIVLTDELLNLLVSDEEIVAVCAHEIGHLVGRHSMRQILQAASVTALSYFLIGDATETVPTGRRVRA